MWLRVAGAIRDVTVTPVRGANAIITASGIDDTPAHCAKFPEQSFLALRSWMPSLTWPRVAEAVADGRQLSRCTQHVRR